MDLTGHTIRSLVDQHAEKTPDQTYVIYPDTGISHTWREFRIRVQSMALYLESMEFPQNLPVAGLLGNGQAAMELFLGGMYGGFPDVPYSLELSAANPQLAGKQLHP